MDPLNLVRLHRPRALEMALLVAPFMALFMTLLASPLAASDRYELGKRLQRFEREWQGATPVSRARAVAPMQSAVGSFFTLQFGRAAKNLDEAWFAIRSDELPNAEERAAFSQRILLAPRLIDTASTGLKVSTGPCYSVEGMLDPGAQIRLELRRMDGTVAAKQSFPWSELPQGVTLKLDEAGPGDFQLVLVGTVGAKSIELPPVMVSRVERLAERMAAIEQAQGQWPESAAESVRATVASLHGLLKSIGSDQVQETDFPAQRLIDHCEKLIASKGQSVGVLRELAAGQDAWITLAREGRQAPVRARAPKLPAAENEATTKTLPVLFLFHGAGGSENMFFDAYGAGRAVDLGTQRGWLVVATRQTLSDKMDCAALVDILSESFPVDRNRVFCMGHSMGAGQVVRQVSRHPELMKAAVALGGGARPGNAESLRPVRWFVGAGDADFGRSGAASLARSLEKSSVPVTYREYKNVEHMVIVQAALDDVFSFFDDVNRDIK